MDQEREDADIRIPQPTERRHDVDTEGTIQPWEEGPNTQGFQHGTWNYNHDTRDEVGPAIAANEGEEETGEREREK